ncbi:hypothetical protein K1719_047073 [Acacia pycnantha]|nr:hypothetical protein K1719_047073 [Acacia pycnantha]
MDAPIIDPLQGDFPEVIEEYLEHGCMKCIAFNRRGTLLAAGCNDGSCIIWDFETRGIAKELRDYECSSPITSVCWSKYGHQILVSAADKSLTLWDVKSGEKIKRIVLRQTPLQARLHPGSSTPSLCLACPVSCAPMIVGLNTGYTTLLQVSFPEIGNGSTAPSRNKSSMDLPLQPNCCIGQEHSVQQKWAYLLTNSNDRIIGVYENLLPLKEEIRALDDLNENLNDLGDVEKLKVVGSKCLNLFCEFQDSITKVHRKAPCFSGDGEWVVGGSASKGEHKIYIWDRAGHLVKILEGPKEALIDLAWHPVRPIIVSVSLAGLVYIWAKDYTENWSAFALDFKELEENEEYVEREDEFDLIPETEKVKASMLMKMRKWTFRDEQQDKCLESFSKLVDSNNSGSPLSEDLGPNEHMNHASSPLEDDAGGTHMKRKRKPSEKGLELQAERVKKPSKFSKSSKSKSKSFVDQDNGDSLYADELSDE